MTADLSTSGLDAPLSKAMLAKAAGELKVPLCSEQLDRLMGFLALLIRWNGTYNLTAIRSPEDMVRQHLVDCLACVAPLRRETSGLTSVRLLDVGSGGGLPGVVIAVACPDIDVTCVDTVGKKAAFISQVAGTLGLPRLRAHRGRVESAHLPPFDIVASRAFAALPKFTAWTRHLLASDGKWMAMKGRVPTEEIAQLGPNIEVFHVEPLSSAPPVLERCLVWLKPISK